MNVKTQKIASSVHKKAKSGRLKYWLDTFVLLVMCSLLYYGASWQIFMTYTDAAKYQCYAVAFWKGLSALETFPSAQCDFMLHSTDQSASDDSLVKNMQKQRLPASMIRYIATPPSTERFHQLPHEYPLLTIIPFTLALVAPLNWYQVAFACWMILVAAVIYILLIRFRSRRASQAYALYLVIGGWATAAGRFDLIPSALTLLALLFTGRKKWNWAFALLALATLFKFYPLVLIFPFLLAQQMTSGTKWYAWQRWRPLAMFVSVCTLVMVASLCLSVEGTLAPLSYFDFRPIQVESFSASLIWLSSYFGHFPLGYDFTFGSLNMFSPLSSKISLLSTVFLGVGLLYTYWLQWRAKIDLAVACLLTLLIVMITGKVFSPQYLIWVIPLIAYIGESDPWWLVSWVMIGLLTTWVYPYIYDMGPLTQVPYLTLFFPVTTVRNLLLLGFVLSLLLSVSRKRTEKVTLPLSEITVESPLKSEAARV